MIEYSINVEEDEKLKTKVADNEVIKEKIQAEEQYLKEKQITTG